MNAFQSKYALIFHCFLVHLKTTPRLILLGFSFGGMFFSFLIKFKDQTH